MNERMNAMSAQIPVPLLPLTITILISDLIRCQRPAGVFLAGRGKFSAYS